MDYHAYFHGVEPDTDRDPGDEDDTPVPSRRRICAECGVEWTGTLRGCSCDAPAVEVAHG